MTHSSAEIRSAFLGFFARHQHEIVASGPLVPPNDPSLMFANAGMVQFKDLFTGREQRAYRRATSSQKCIRISGKHNDLEAVGPSPRHHTFFEMLGNFSFGDYFKEDAIAFAWKFLTEELGLAKERLGITYFRGTDAVAADEQARDLWKSISGFGEERIIGLGADDNFWQMGDTGPCGPCSEIYYCTGPDIDPRGFHTDEGREAAGWMEIWNLVFMQFERTLGPSTAGQPGVIELRALPKPSIDTGAGLERLARVVQGVDSNYAGDLLAGLVECAAGIAKKQYGGSMSPDDVSLRVIADHARTTAFLISEGLMPDRAGREYVLRRVMRRAIRHGHRLGIAKPFLHEVTARVVDLMGGHYPELRERQALIASVAEGEEVRFRDTIERGLSLLDEQFDALRGAGEQVLRGDEAFKLYDTYGFPLDLTEVICAERGFSVDTPGYEAALEQARKRSEFKGSDVAIDAVYREALGKESVRFTGYELTSDRGTILALIKDGQLVERVVAGDQVQILTDRTPFYGEAGGQVGDQGVIDADSGHVVIDDAIKPVSGSVFHLGRVEHGELTRGQSVALHVDGPRRERVRRNHSATHLLHFALRKVLGPQAQQKGSLVEAERFRFDFAHSSSVSAEQIQRIEDLVNEQILMNHAIVTEVLSMQEARSKNAMMIFEEKYGDTVRMLSMGESVELCGGTHARATGEIGLFKILSEQGIAAGVRRIVATTGLGTLLHLRELEATLGRAARAAKTSTADLPEKIEKLLSQERQLEKQIEALQRKLLSGGGGIEALLGQAREVSGVKVLGLRTDVTDRGALRELAEQLRDKLGDSVVLVGSEADGKAQLVLTVAKPLTQRFKAGELIKALAGLVAGTGGGRPDMAQAGGTDVQRLDDAIEAVYTEVARVADGAAR